MRRSCRALTPLLWSGGRRGAGLWKERIPGRVRAQGMSSSGLDSSSTLTSLYVMTRTDFTNREER